MSSQRFSVPDVTRSKLRRAVATIGREIARLPTAVTNDVGTAPDGLRASFADLVEELALGPEPEMRECPVCKHVGMRAATLCGHCWTKLTPPSGRDPLAG
jgi:hypothetical protein